MAFFLETLFGGLMAGMLYSLVALGFVLIFKASGVFNFAQGAMVLFAALAMARFSEWIPRWLGMDNALVANILAFVVAGAIAWKAGLLMMVAATAGGFFGARWSKRLPVAWVRAGVVVIGLLMSAVFFSRQYGQ